MSDEERMLRILTIMSGERGRATPLNRKNASAIKGLSKATYNDEQIWDALKIPGAGGKTELMYAAKTGNIERVRFLLKRSHS